MNDADHFDDADPQQTDEADEAALTLEVEFDPHVSFAMHQNDVPIIKRVRICNGGGALSDVVLRASIRAGSAGSWERRIDAIPAASTYNLDLVDLPLDGKALHEQVERERTLLEVQLLQGDEVIASFRGDVQVLAHNEWPGMQSLPELLAAFVLPNHPQVQRVLVDARAHLERISSQPSLSGYQSGRPEHFQAIVASVYRALAAQDLGYINPPASFEKQGQKVRLPDALLEQRMGTCLDLTLLLAACIEQAGLHPLIVMVRGHAFVGVWMQDTPFAEPLVEEPLRIRKRVQLGEILVLDPTVLANRPVPSLEESSRVAERHLADLDAFVCAIDVRCARTMSITPLPTRHGGDAQVNFARAAVDVAPAAPASSPTHRRRRPTEMVPAEAREPEEPPSARLERWKRRLLDLSLNNRLLNFRETKKTVPLLCPDVATMEDVLAEGERMTLLPQPDLMTEGGPRRSDIHAQRTGGDAKEQFLQEALRKRRLHASLTDVELDRRLLEVYRAARSSIEESGTNTLFLAVGFLSWFESESSSQQRLAPILLVPVSLDRDIARSRFMLSHADDEPRVNVTLLEKLKHDFGLEAPGLDDLTTDESGLDVPAILTRFRQLIKDRDRWDVLDTAELGLFSFTKFLMWQDLHARTQVILQNPVVRHLVDRPGQRFEPEGEFPSPGELDARRSPAETFCPMDADSSQLAAIYAGHDGRSFVLEGPPGTGKSQTITNLIAHCLGHGKRVLFVSEKRAALTVVQRRLSAVGLAPFCLELHSNKANKREVLDQLQSALDVAGTSGPQQWDRHVRELTAARSSLNALVAAIHQRRSIGLSVFHVTSKLIGLRDAPRLQLPMQDVAALPEQHFAELCQVVEQLAHAAEVVGPPTEHPLRAIGRGAWSAALPDVLRDLGSSIQRLVQRTEEALRELLQTLGLPMQEPASSRAIRWLLDLSHLLLESVRPPASLLSASDWKAAKPLLDELLEIGRRRDQLRNQIHQSYQAELLRENVVVLRGELAAAQQKWFLPRWLGTRAVRQKITPYAKSQLTSDTDKLLSDLDTMIEIQRLSERLNDPASPAKTLFGELAWRQGEADWEALGHQVDWADRFQRLLATAPADQPAWSVRSAVMALAVERRDELQLGGPAEARVKQLAQPWDELRSKLRKAESELQVNPPLAWGAEAEPGHLLKVAQTAGAWIEHAPSLNDWCYWRRCRQAAVESRMDVLVGELEAGRLRVDQLQPAFERSVLQQWLNAVTDSEEVLRSFNSHSHQESIQRFRRLDREYLDLSRQHLVAKLAGSVPQVYGEPAASSEMGILQRQLRLQRRHMPVRKLIQQLPHLLPKLKPCVLMSPLSVAQYLDPEFPLFDLVVFDEASQIPVWDAVGAIARGRQAIVVGDSKQLPPTNFFARLSGDEYAETDEEFEELESVLDECTAAGLAPMQLLWHYRSRHESLIAFSNYHYYNNRLNTFPSSVDSAPNLGVSWRHIKDGHYDRSRSRTNQAEAEAVVHEIVRRLTSTGGEADTSIGVVTFSMAQQVLIENLLDEARREHPEIEHYFSSDCDEPVFVKNLENVQGDERAVILFSVCYGPDETGRVSMNFGPLNRQGGQRRLNVAITRARNQVIVFSTLRADQIDLSRTSSEGVRHLKTFLDYAHRGPAAIAEAITLDGGEHESPFEQDVADALVSLGWDVVPQVGCSGYRIDLGVKHPDAEGAFLLGIECDGAFYHSAKTARDRDRLRQAVLESLGWQLHRIWSTDWWRNRDGELRKLDEALRDAMRRPRASEPQRFAAPAPVESRQEPATAPSAEDRSNGNDPQPMPPGMLLYEEYRPGRGRRSPTVFYEDDARLLEAIAGIMEKEAPISVRLLTRRLMTFWGLSRQTSRVDERVQQLLSVLVPGSATLRDDFVWQAKDDPAAYKGFRVPANDERPREIEDIPLEEIANACHSILKQQVSLPPSDLSREAARLFGIQRLTERVEARVTDAVQLLIDGDRATRINGRVALS